MVEEKILKFTTVKRKSARGLFDDFWKITFF